MKMYFAESTMGFYTPEINGTDIPEDAVEISDEEYQAFLNGQSLGLVLKAVNQRPVMVKYVPTADDIRHKRDYKLQTEVDVLVSNPLRWGSLTTEEQQAWATYRQALLDIPEQEGFPENVIWPELP